MNVCVPTIYKLRNYPDICVVSKLYPAKILIAWSEAIKGNGKIRDWLTSNGYPELGIFCFAVRNKDDARQWLLTNKFPHLMALINGAEGNQEAVRWLFKNGYKPLAYVAIAGDGYKDGHHWLIKNNHPELARVAQQIFEIKEQLEDDNNDMHRISPD